MTKYHTISSASSRTAERKANTMYFEQTGAVHTQRQSRQFETPQPKTQHIQWSNPARSSSRSVGKSSSQKRRSSSAQKYSTVHIRRHSGSQHQAGGGASNYSSSSQGPSYQIYAPSLSRNGNNPEDYSDAGSVSSAPSLKYSSNTRDPFEYRDPASSSSKHGARMLYRDESPSSSKRLLPETPQRHTKTAKKIVEELQKANTQERRIAAITNACAEFDHSDEQKHGIELQNGAAVVLAKLLRTTDDEDEIRMILVAIEMVFRAKAKYVHVAADKCSSVLIPGMLKVLERCESGNMKHADVSILNITKTLHYISRIPELRMSLARYPGMLDSLRRVATSILSPESRITRVRVIANLTNCDENKELLLEHAGLLDSILRIAHLDLSESAREYAGMALMDLASESVNQIPMAKNEKLLGTLVKMVLVEKMASTRESAITALQNLAFSKENRQRLVGFKSGIVLEALKKALSGDKNDKARRRAAGALTNLACEETAEVIGGHKSLLDTLAIVSTKDVNTEVQTRASMALTKLAASISIDMECFEPLLDALVVASLSRSANSISAVLRVKAREPENREAMANHPGILDTLADICVDLGTDVKDKDNAIRAIMHLTNEKSNRTTMCTVPILDALVKGAMTELPKKEDSTELEDPAYAEIQVSAIRSLERLATEVPNRSKMAKHNGLLVAVAHATEREAKLMAAGKKSDHPYLAKPLLMSLLISM